MMMPERASIASYWRRKYVSIQFESHKPESRS